MSETVTQHRTRFWLTQDLAVEFSVFDHGNSEVPAAAWQKFSDSYMLATGVRPAHTLTEYVVNHAQWTWDTTYSDGTVVIGDPEGPLALEAEPAGPEGCRIVFWDEGNPYDTGLRVWADEATIIARTLGTDDESED